MDLSLLTDVQLIELKDKLKGVNNIIYTGAPLHFTWADFPDGDNRGWFEFDDSDGSIELRRNTSEDSLFHIFEYDHTKSLDEINLTPLVGKISRVVVNEIGDTRRYNKFLAALRALDVIECKVVDRTIVQKSDKEKVKVDTSKIIGGNILTTIVVYAADLAKTVPGADESIVRSMTVDLYNGANK